MDEEVKCALRLAVRSAGSQRALAESAQMTQSRISDYLNNRFKIGNITLNTLCRLFPGMRIDFFPEQVAGEREKEGAEGWPEGVDDSFSAAPEWINRRELERKIRHCEALAPEERLDFLNFLDEKL